MSIESQQKFDFFIMILRLSYYYYLLKYDPLFLLITKFLTYLDKRVNLYIDSRIGGCFLIIFSLSSVVSICCFHSDQLIYKRDLMP